MDLTMLNMDHFHTSCNYKHGNAAVNLEVRIKALRPAIEALMNHGLVRDKLSLGGAIGGPIFLTPGESLAMPYWNDPYGYVWFVFGWGPDWQKYAANAIRKMRALLRTGVDTLELQLFDSGRFQDRVVSEDDDHNYPWGDFPYGGATFTKVGNLYIPAAVSTLRAVEDDNVSRLYGGTVGQEMLKVRYPGLAA